MRTAFVGGGSAGIGLGCAEALAAVGCRVIICARGAAALDTAAARIRGHSRTEIVPMVCDLSDANSLRDLGRELAHRDLEIDILINNVGGPPPGAVTELSEEDWERALDLLFRSTLRLYGMVLPGMRRRGWGRIVNVLSTAAVEPVRTLATSSVIRAALVNYAKLVAWDVASEGVTVNSVLPAALRTARTEALEFEAARRESVPLAVIQERVRSSIPLGRLLEPIELGGLVAFLASDGAAGITGALIPFDAGSMRSA